MSGCQLIRTFKYNVQSTNSLKIIVMFVDLKLQVTVRFEGSRRSKYYGALAPQTMSRGSLTLLVTELLDCVCKL